MKAYYPVQCQSQIVYLGVNHQPFPTEDEARESFIRRDLAEILLKNNVVEDYDLGVAAEQIITHRKNLIRALQFLDSPHLLNNEIDIIRGLQAALAQCTDQMAQMKGMFDDDDSAIERALEEAEEMQQKASRFLGEVVS